MANELGVILPIFRLRPNFESCKREAMRAVAQYGITREPDRVKKLPLNSWYRAGLWHFEWSLDEAEAAAVNAKNRSVSKPD